MYRRAFCALIFFAFLVSGSQAQDLFIRNAPFKGTVVRDGGKVWIALVPFAEAIGWKVEGKGSTGYALSKDGSLKPAAVDLVTLEEGTVPCRLENGEALVPLEGIASLVGAKVIENKELGTIDVHLLTTNNQVASTDSFGSKRYTLIEYSYPPDPLCQYIQPVLGKAKEKYGDEVAFQLCDVRKSGLLAQYLKYKSVKNSSFPEVTLLDSSGQILFQLRGNHVIEKELMNALRKAVK